MDVILKQATRADTDMLVRLMEEYYQFDHLPWDEAGARTALQGLMCDQHAGRVWLISADEEIVGYVALTLGYSLEYKGRDAFVDEIYLREGYRGRGLGQQALAAVFETCQALGVRAVHLEVARNNTAAQALYRKLGFEVHSSYLMSKLITPIR